MTGKRKTRAPTYLYVAVLDGPGEKGTTLYGDSNGRPYRKMSTAEGAAKAIHAHAYVLPIERWA